MGRCFPWDTSDKHFVAVQKAIYIQESHWSWGKSSCQASGRFVSIGTHAGYLAVGFCICSTQPQPWLHQNPQRHVLVIFHGVCIDLTHSRFTAQVFCCCCCCLLGLAPSCQKRKCERRGKVQGDSWKQSTVSTPGLCTEMHIYKHICLSGSSRQGNDCLSEAVLHTTVPTKNKWSTLKKKKKKEQFLWT